VTETPKRRLTWRRVAIAIGAAERPPDSATPEGRTEDWITKLGVKGGKWGLVAWAVLQLVGSMKRQTEVLEVMKEQASAQLQESREHKIVLMGLTEEQKLTIEEQKLTREQIGSLSQILALRQGEKMLAPVVIQPKPVVPQPPKIAPSVKPK